MAQRLNKKILCFVDEHGTAGTNDFYLGAVIVFAREAGAVDKRFSDQLPASAKEVRASNLSDRYIQGLLEGLMPRDNLIMINRGQRAREPVNPRLYAQAVVDTVKIGAKRFRKDVARLPYIGNIDVIVDANQHNTHSEFEEEIEKASQQAGVFQGVNRVSAIDSAASRLLQLADVVAHSRKWHATGQLTAEVMRARFGIHIL